MNILTGSFAVAIIVGIVVAVLVLVYEKMHWKKIQKTVELFVEEVNSGKRVVYCSDKIGRSLLLDDKGNVVFLAKLYIEVKSDVFCNPHFITNCYRVIIEDWRYGSETIIMYIKPMDNALDKWRVKEISENYIVFSHPIMADQTVFGVKNASAYRVGDTVTLRSSVTSSPRFGVRNHLAFKIVN